MSTRGTTLVRSVEAPARPGRAQASLWVVILSMNQRADTLECLASVLDSRLPGGLSVVLIDQGSVDGTLEEVRSHYTLVHVIEAGRNLGFAGGNNAGVRYALERGAAYVALLNNDTVVAADMFAQLRAALEASPDVGVAGPAIFYHDQPERMWPSAGGWQHLTMSTQPNGRPPSHTSDVDYIAGCCMLVPRRVWERVGLLDEGYHPIYYEDHDFCLRVTQAGFRLIQVPQARMTHKIAQTYGLGTPRRAYIMARNSVRFFARHTHGLHRLFVLCYRLGSLVKTMAGSLVARQPEVGLAYLHGLVDGLRDLWRASSQVGGGDARAGRTWTRPLAGFVVVLAIGLLVGRQLVAEWGRVQLTGLRFAALPLALAYSIQTVGLLVIVDTWRVTLLRFGSRPLAFTDHLRIYANSNVARLLPGSLWGAVGRVAWYRRLGVSAWSVSTAVLVEWLLLGAAGLILFGLASTWLPGGQMPDIGLVAAVSIGVLAFLHPAVFNRLMLGSSRLLQRVRHYKAADLSSAGQTDMQNPRGSESPRVSQLDVAGWLARQLMVLLMAGVALSVFLHGITGRTDPLRAVAAMALSTGSSNLLIWMPVSGVVREGLLVLLLRPALPSISLTLAAVALWRVWSIAVTFSWVGLAAAAVRVTHGHRST
jgi:hypothetical protein